MADVYWGVDAPGGKVWINHARRADFLADIEDRLRTRCGFTLATLNLDHCVKLRSDPDFRAAYLAHSHVVADGNPIVWLSRHAGRRVDLMNGCELIAPLAELAARHDVPVAFLGSTDETLTAARTALQDAYPGLEIVALLAPPFGFEPTGASAERHIAALRDGRAGLCFLALGAPKQEIFAAHAARALPGCGLVSIGAGLDFIAGTQRRAPAWVRRIALEWLWRYLGNPRRMARRYAACIAILPALMRDARRDRA